jgi:tetratricopeptide (TPR) repeat protein
MKLLLKSAMVVALVFCIVGSPSAKDRVLPAKAYISSAKIEILGYGSTKEKVRIETAIGMLDSLFMHYGPHSEGYFWYSQIQWDLAAEEGDLKLRLPFVNKAVVYADSLRASCSNKDIKKNYRKDCESLSEEMDSIKVVQWREYYNAGVAQLAAIKESLEAVKVVTDSAEQAWYKTNLDALVDSCQSNMALCIAIDSTDGRPYIGLATIFERTEDYSKAVEYLEEAAAKSPDREQIVISIAYDYIQMNEFCRAIPWFQEYIDTMTTDDEVMQDPERRASVLGNAHNLAICLNNCKEYERASEVYQQILSYDPEDFEAYAGVGRYFRQLGRDAADSSRVAQEAGNTAKRDEWMAMRDVQFDSSRVYLGKAFEFNPDDAGLAAEWALMEAILQNYAAAKIGFARAAELDPGEVDYWISLGDCNLSLKEWAGAAEAYEHVVELQPNKKNVWEQLEALYQQMGNAKRRAEVQAKLKTM